MELSDTASHECCSENLLPSAGETAERLNHWDTLLHEILGTLHRPTEDGPVYHRLVGLVVKASASGAEDLGFESRLRQDFSWSSHTGDFEIGTPVATLPGAGHYRVSAGTGGPCVSILWLGEVDSLICKFYLSVAARNIVCADPSLRYASMLLGR